MVLIQLLLPRQTSAGADHRASLAATRRELTDRFHGLTAYIRSPPRDGGPRRTAAPRRTMS
jgi:hypothetical protein